MLRPSERLRGMGMGSLFLAFFGALWMLVALDAQSLLWVVACVLLPLSLLVLRAIGLMHAARQANDAEPPPTAEEAERARRTGRRFAMIFLLEFGLIAVAANLLKDIGHADAMVPVIGVIVGIHFLPLARVFDYPLYYWTGGAEIALCALIAVALRARLGAADPLIGLAMGLSLWMTVLILLVQGRWLAARVRAATVAPEA